MLSEPDSRKYQAFGIIGRSDTTALAFDLSCAHYKIKRGKSPLLFHGEPDAIRTRDLCLRRATLYPAELRVL